MNSCLNGSDPFLKVGGVDPNLFDANLDESLSGCLLEASDLAEDIDLGDFDKSWMNGMTLDDILQTIKEPKSDHVIKPSLSETVGHQTLNDLLNAPPLAGNAAFTETSPSCHSSVLSPQNVSSQITGILQPIPQTKDVKCDSYHHSVPLEMLLPSSGGPSVQQRIVFNLPHLVVQPSTSAQAQKSVANSGSLMGAAADVVDTRNYALTQSIERHPRGPALVSMSQQTRNTNVQLASGDSKSMNAVQTVPAAQLSAGNDSREGKDQPLKKSPHNEIEKRYRLSINCKIDELREMLSIKDEKLSKAAVLKKATDYIRYLINANKRLKVENAILKKHISLSNKVVVRDLIRNNVLFTDIDEGDSPSSMAENCDRFLTPPRSDPTVQDSPRAVEKLQSGTQVQKAKQSQRLNLAGRTTVALFMVTILIFNPIGSLFQSYHPEASTIAGSQLVGRRVLEEPPTSNMEQSWLNWGLAWGLNLLVTLSLFLTFFVHNKSACGTSFDNSTEYWRHRRQADSDMSKQHFSSAVKHLQQCLVCLGQSPNMCSVDLCKSWVWNGYYVLVNQVKMLVPDIAWKVPAEKPRSVREAAEVYDMLNRLYIAGHTTCHDCPLVFALSAVNIAEFATVNERQLVEIYLGAALRFAWSSHKTLHLMAHVLFSKVQQLVKRNRSGKLRNLTWMCHRRACSFMLDLKSVDLKQLRSSTECFPIDDQLDVVELFGKCFSRAMLSASFNTVVLSRVDDFKKRKNGGGIAAKDHWSNAFQYVQLARESSLVGTKSDPVWNWWCSVASAAVHWQIGNDESAADHAREIEEIPTKLQCNDSPLCLALYSTFSARRDYSELSSTLSDGNGIVGKCDIAGKFLAESLICTKAADLETQIQLLACNWLLSVRMSVWRRTYCSDGVTRRAPLHFLSGFERDLNSLRRLCQTVKAAMPLLYLHEAAERIMASAGPIRTQQLIARTVRMRRRSGCD